MTGSRWRLEEVEGVTLVRCASLETVPGVVHAFSTRAAFGRTDFDLGRSEPDPDGERTRLRAFFRASGFGAARAASIRQVHGCVIIDAVHRAGPPPEADGVIRVFGAGAPAPVPAVRTADCVAVLMADRLGTVTAAIHAGWRGAAAKIVPAAVTRFAAAGVAPRDLIVALGPAILGCCYEVGEDVVSALAAACGGEATFTSKEGEGSTTVDLHAVLRSQLVVSGIPIESIHAAPWCTRCRADLFFSHRRDGTAAGRHLAAVGPAVRP